ncbi:MAG: polysaccharide biosynthesis C-terminal domain-containing protein [Chitinophagaceae bacterium]|nr:polysaccharide biosynthesis C-terminal domain-containing protein [Chitinophagaceae bacterium]
MEFKYHAKKLLGDSFIYGLSGIITSFIGVFLIPLYTNVFDPSDYGIIALLGSLQTIVTIFIIFGMDNSFGVWYYDNPSEAGKRITVSNWFFFSLTLGFFVALLLVSGSYYIAKFLLGNSQLYPLIILFAINIFLASTQKVLNIWFRVRRKPVHAVSFNLVISLLNIALNILFVLKLGIGLPGIYYSVCITSLITLIITIYILREHLAIKYIDFKELRKMLVFSLPLVPTGLIFWLMGSATPYFINFLMHSKTEIGLYQIGASGASLLTLATFAFFSGFTAYALSISKEENARKIYAKILEYYIYIGMTCALLLGLLAKFILQILTNEKYISAYIVIGILAFNIVIAGVIQVVSLANLLAKDNKPIAKSAIYSVGVTVIGYFTLIPLLGKEGAAIAVGLGNLVTTVYVTVKAQKLYFIPYNFKRIVSFSIACIIIYIVYLELV